MNTQFDHRWIMTEWASGQKLVKCTPYLQKEQDAALKETPHEHKPCSPVSCGCFVSMWSFFDDILHLFVLLFFFPTLCDIVQQYF